MGEAAEGVISFVGWSSRADTPGNQAFLENYTIEYGRVAHYYAALSYATLYILKEAVDSAESTDSTAIRNALANIRDFDTILGKFSFNTDGDAIYAPSF